MEINNIIDVKHNFHGAQRSERCPNTRIGEQVRDNRPQTET
jgi:hypothetical protein